MSRRRFYAPPEALERGFVSLATEEARHLRDVLRLKKDDEAFVFDGAGNEYACLVREIGRGNGPARLEVREQVAAPSPESLLELTLGLSLLKGEKFDLVVQKATELGVARITPIVTKRADVRLRDENDTARRVARWHRLALEACKQSGRAVIPVVESPVALGTFFERSKLDDTCLMFAEATGNDLAEVVERTNPRPQSLSALVGPEGGWDEEELVQGRNAGWEIITLGGRTLRAETAAIAVTVLLQHLFGDLS